MIRLNSTACLLALWMLSMGPGIGEVRAQHLWDFRSGPLQPALDPESGRWGYMDLRRLEFLIEPNFEFAGPFSEDLAAVRVDGKYGYIDMAGRIVIEPAYPWAGSFSEGLAPVRLEEGRYGFINSSGVQRFALPAQAVGSFSEGLAWIRRENGFGYVASDGEVHIEPRFQLATDFSEGLAAVKLDGHYGYIDQRGKTAVRFAFDSAGEFSEGTAWVRQRGKYGYIDKRGNAAIAVKFDGAFPFFRGAAAVRMGTKSGVVDTRGKMVFKPRFDSIMFHTDRVALCRVGNNLVMPQTNSDEILTGVQPGGLGSGANTDWLEAVEFQSNPKSAEVYCPTLWDFDHAADIETLLTPENRIPEGDTNVKTHLNKWQEYRAVFVKEGKREIRRCVPSVHKKITVEFR